MYQFDFLLIYTLMVILVSNICKQTTVVWVFFVCTNFPEINIQRKKFSRSLVIAKIKRTKIKRTKILLRRWAHDLVELEGVDVCVRGQHIYKDIWYAVVGEVLVCKREPNNFQDRYAKRKIPCV